jgi:diketogulonate reductase-like aldo/keto reductase
MDETMIVWRQFETFIADGTVHQIGISNCYDINVLKELYNRAITKPAVVQNRFYEQSKFDVEIRRFCRENGIEYQSFWTLTAVRGKLGSSEAVAMAKELGVPSSQVLHYLFVQKLGITPLDGTTSERHMEEDLAMLLGTKNVFEANREAMERFSRIVNIPLNDD